MGKQSKRKAVSKKEHKERQEERRTRVLQEASTRNDNNDGADDESYDDRVEEIMAGDRVWWFYQPGRYCWRRGVVRRVVMDEFEPGMSRYLVQRIEDEDGKELIAVTASDRTITGSDESARAVRRDRNDWVPRFAVGDRVLGHVRMGDDNSESIWVPATVSKLWATPPNSALLNVYKCHLDVPIADFSAGTPLYFEDDSEGMITEHSSTIRFSVGDVVLFSPENAAFFHDNRATKVQPWKEGRIVRVDVSGQYDPCPVYEVSFMGPRNRRTTCDIRDDNDEHICRIDATPRERLLDAIDQCCSYAHIDYLVTATELDVTTFQDLLVGRAIQSCSYDAIWWLQDKTNIELVRVVDTNGSGILHQISTKPQAVRFFERTSEVECENEGNKKLDLSPFLNGKIRVAPLSLSKITKAARGCMSL
jgi:hypothetical protein